MSERIFEQTQDKKRRMDAAAERLKSHLAKLATDGSPQQIVRVGRTAEYVTNLSRELADQALEQEAAYYVSEYASPQVGAQTSPRIEIPKIVDKDGKNKIGQPVEPSASGTLQGTDRAARSSAELADLPPNIKIYLNTKEVEIDGMKGKFAGSLEFNAVRLLSQSRSQAISSSELNKAMKRLGAKTHAGVLVFSINKKFKKEFSIDQLIVPEGNSKRKRVYRLNAKVELIGERPITKIRRESRDIHEVDLPGGDRIEVMGAFRHKILKRLLTSSVENPVSSITLAKDILGNSRRDSRKRVGSSLGFVRVILRENDLDLFSVTNYEPVRGKRRKVVSYWIGEREKESAKRQEEFLQRPVLDTRLDALEKFMSEVDVSIDEIIEMLGPSKTGRMLTNPQTAFALKRAVNVLYLRVEKGIADERETRVFESIKAGTMKQDNKLAIDTFKAGIESWFKSRRGVSQQEKSYVQEEERKEIEGLSSDEAGVLALLILRHRGVKVSFAKGNEYVFEPGEPIADICKSLVSQITFKGHEMDDTERANYLDLRTKAVKKAQEILKSQSVDEIIDSQSDEVQTLLTWLYCEDQDKMSGLLFNFLDEPPERFWTVEKSQLKKLWKEWSPSQAGLKKNGRELNGLNGKLEVSDAERAIFGEAKSILEDNKVGLSLSGAQVTRLFSFLTAKKIGEYTVKGYINPSRNKKNIPMYTKEDIVLMVSAMRLGNNLKRKEVRNLRQKVKNFLAS